MKLDIAAIRKRQGLSQATLAARLNVTQEIISRIETGHRRLYVEELSPFATALGCTVQDLLGEGTKEALRKEHTQEER